MSSEQKPLVNKVAQSGLITIKLEEYLPTEPVVAFDLKDYLFMELILKEKDFREALKAHDWEQYRGINLVVFCSADAVIPTWAYMLVASHAEPYAKRVFEGTPGEFYKVAILKALDQLDPAVFQDQRIVVKGCGDKPVPPAAYMELTRRLQPYAQSIMFGEPCSTVPIFKRPRALK